MYRYIIVLHTIVWLGIFLGCEPKPTEPKNHPPFTPSHPYPADSATNVAVKSLTLTWRGGDPDAQDVVYYDIYFDTLSTPKLICANKCTVGYRVDTLLYQTSYYWRIIARDSHGDSTVGPLWVFTTRMSTNQPPFSPRMPSPRDSATQQKVTLTLSWIGGDPDVDDVVRYDIYLDTLSSPSILATGNPTTSYSVTGLKFAKWYYWKIVARDTEGDTTVGSIWRFSTQDTMVVKKILAAPASEPIGLAWDSTNLWVSDSIADKIYAIDTATAGVVKSFASPGPAPTGLTWDSTYLWVSDCGTKKIYKIDPTSGAAIDSFFSPDSCPMGLAWKDSTSLWNVGAYTKRIYELNPQDGSVIRHFPAPGNSPTGLAVDTAYLWICDLSTKRVYKVNPVSGLDEQSFLCPGSSPMGITWEGMYLWNADTYTEKLYKLKILTAP